MNGESFLLTFTERSWIAQVEGKKYYLLNIDEEAYTASAMSSILHYGPESGAEVEGSETDSAPVEDEVDVDVDVEA